MTLTLDHKLAEALEAESRRSGLSPEQFAVNVLREKLAGAKPVIDPPQDEWARRLRSAATDCGVSLSNEALSSDGIYE